jgi:alpha-D-ribose 1-methylphosphonate 5-triphosphate synthase subunit PhnG
MDKVKLRMVISTLTRLRRYKHDCSACLFVGEHGEYDVYVCPQNGLPTIVARYGDEGSEYVSGDAGVTQLPVLVWGNREALKMLLRRNDEHRYATDSR